MVRGKVLDEAFFEPNVHEWSLRMSQNSEFIDHIFLQVFCLVLERDIVVIPGSSVRDICASVRPDQQTSRICAIRKIILQAHFTRWWFVRHIWAKSTHNIVANGECILYEQQ